MTEFPIAGGCHCGAVRYTILGAPDSVEHCHCSMCRKIDGSLVATGAAIRRNLVRVEQGEDNLTNYCSSPGVTRQFCRTCGCPLFYYDDSWTEVQYFNPATLDGGVHPGHPAGKECHIHVASRAEWEHFDDDLPKFDKDPGEIGIGLTAQIEVKAGARRWDEE